MATISRSGRPRSSTSTARPPTSSAMASSPDSRAMLWYRVRPKTDATDATFKAPEAATMRKTAKMCGVPQTIWLSIPVTWWPLDSM